MILLFVFALAAVSGEHLHQDGLRRSRQLDLGLQDITNEKPQTNNQAPSAVDVLDNGYLPPISAPLPQKVVAAQSQQASVFKSTNGIENDLCQDPFGSFLCKLRESSSKGELKIPKPSRDLVPPFNDLQQGTPAEKESKTKPKIEESSTNTDNFSVYSAVSHSTFATTTRRPVSKTIEPAKSIQDNKIFKPLGEPLASGKAEATNELRSYLPPQSEYSAAAQTSVGVVRPPEQNNEHDHDHDHHHGHHGHHHGDICSDAFHSFLCAPLKARKRITGALPNNLRGQSSFVQYQKALPDKETAPSNAFRNEYLPPKPVAASNTISSTVAPPRTTTQRIFSPTTTTPKLILESSNENDRFYLPPVTNNKIFNPFNPASSNRVDNTLQIISTTRKPVTFATPVVPYHSKTVTNFSPVLVSVTTAKPIVALPIVPSTIIVPANSFPPVISTFTAQSATDNFYLPPKSNLQSQASFISTTSRVFPTSTTLRPQPSVFPKVSTFAPLPSSNVFASVPTKIQRFPVVISTTQKPYTATTPSPSTTAFVTTPRPVIRPSTFIPLPANIDNSYLPPQPKFQSASNLISTTIKPFTTTTRKPLPTFAQQPATLDRSYLPADPNVQPAAAQINAEAVAAPGVKNPFHHGRDLCTDPFHSFLCASAKPRKRITGALPSGFRPDSSNTKEVKVRPSPSLQNENRVKPDKPLVTSPSQSVGYNYPKPVNPLPNPTNTIPAFTGAPTTGYSYPKPDKVFPLPSQQREVKYSPSTPKPIVTKKPAPPVLRTSEARVSVGYEYPKPEKDFPLPSQQGSTVVSTTSKPLTTGYTYDKPQKPFPLPTEQKEVRSPIPKTPSPSSSVPDVSLPTNQAKGYQYPKPQQSFNLPDRKGYSYPKPEKRLELPTETKPKSLLPQQANSKIDLLRDLGSAEFIPVNKLDKREESAQPKFGERLKRREKRLL